MFRRHFSYVLFSAVPLAANQIKAPEQPNSSTLLRPQELPIYSNTFGKQDKYAFISSDILVLLYTYFHIFLNKILYLAFRHQQVNLQSFDQQLKRA